MAKILWLVLLSAPLVGVLFVLWTTMINASTSPPASPVTSQTGAAMPAIGPDDKPLGKADRLLRTETGPLKANIKLQLVSPEPPPKATPPPAMSPSPTVPPKRTAISNARPAGEVTSWHWHAGAKAIKRR
jgi:hypothetical protein